MFKPMKAIDQHTSLAKAVNPKAAHKTTTTGHLACQQRFRKQRRCSEGKRMDVSVKATTTEVAGLDAASVTGEQLPAKYKSLVATSVGVSFRDVATVVENDLKSPGEGEVLVKIAVAGINGGCETFRARGEYAFATNKGAENFRLGAEAAGTVVAVGPNVQDIKVGQHVTVVSGGYSEYAITKPALCYPVRQASAEAVAVSLSGLTAAAALLCTAEIREGETVLVTAAAGGTGHFGVQIALLKGCRVVATCGSAEKAQKLRDLGVHRVINYHEEDVAAVLANEFPQQIDVAYEGVGGKLRDAVLANLSPNGRVLAVGYISEYPHTRSATPSDRSNPTGGSTGNGSVPAEPSQQQQANVQHDWQLPPADKMFWEGMTLHNGSQTIYGQVWPKDRQKVVEAKRWLFGEFEAGRIQAWIDPQRFDGLSQVVPATEHMLSGKSVGKVVVHLA